MSQTEKFSQFTIVHQIKRRIRIVVPCLYRDKERSTILKILLLKRKEIEQVKIISRINSVTILFDPDKLPIQNLLNLLENVLANFSKKPRESIKIKTEKGDRQEKPKLKIVFGIGGMSCTSCALFLEMVLSREQNNNHVSINYISEIGIVSGYLSKAEIFKIIEDNGYQAYSIDTLGERKLLLENEKKHLVIARKRVAIISLMSVPVMLIDLFSRNSKSLRLMQAIISFPIIFLGGQEFF